MCNVLFSVYTYLPLIFMIFCLFIYCSFFPSIFIFHTQRFLAFRFIILYYIPLLIFFRICSYDIFVSIIQKYIAWNKKYKTNKKTIELNTWIAITSFNVIEISSQLREYISCLQSSILFFSCMKKKTV